MIISAREVGSLIGDLLVVAGICVLFGKVGVRQLAGGFLVSVGIYAIALTVQP